ncbi:unnamed protein product, partial [Coregonus sp. 'balchen']
MKLYEDFGKKPVDTDKGTRERNERGQTLVLWLIHRGSGGRTWVLICTALLFSLTERATCQNKLRQRAVELSGIAWAPSKVSGSGLNRHRVVFGAASAAVANHQRCQWPVKCMGTKGHLGHDQVLRGHPLQIHVSGNTVASTASAIPTCGALPTCGVQDIVHESYKGRTKLIGDLQQRNCTLLISNIGTTSVPTWTRANIYTYPDFSELKVLDQPSIDIPEEIVAYEKLELTCYNTHKCPENSPEIQWMYTDYLPEPENTSDFVEESNTTGVYYPNTTLVYERLISLDVKYAPRSVWVNVSTEVMEGSSVTLQCEVDSNPPPRISWLFGDQDLLTQGNPAPTLTWLKDGELVGTITAEEVSVLELLELTTQGDGQYRCLAENEHGRDSSSPQHHYAPVFLEVSKCTVVREGVQYVCMATGNPEPTIEFYLPDKNITINDTDGCYNYYTHTDGHTSTGMIKLRVKGERLGNSAVNVHCSNMYGSESFHLELHQEKKYLMAVFIGTIGGVAVIAFIIAAVRYVGHNNKKANGNTGQVLLKTELLGSKFTSILEEST